MKLWKVLNDDGFSRNGGKCQWSLPTHDGPGEWMPWIEDIKPCVSGYHLCRDVDLLEWLGPAIYEAEADGEIIKSQDKLVCQSARLIRRLDTWNDKTARLFACDCAWKVLPIFENLYPSDMRPRQAIHEAYLFAHGLSTASELAAASDEASDAAWDAARDAAWSAAWDAALDAARAEATAAAWDAARAEARAAVWDAAKAAAKAWQTKRLFSYIYPRN